eukprot:TRINITY_DN54497_c0_g1_i1.p1 TRINITY_DN54497_c0_g1~~TRINITY_DN54497_c0_g1_i1.p1  ORF type:complete len:334 (-),score=42.02 TRINITY_DN54497_c0_g1_i1:182-1183(-)
MLVAWLLLGSTVASTWQRQRFWQLQQAWQGRLLRGEASFRFHRVRDRHLPDFTFVYPREDTGHDTLSSYGVLEPYISYQVAHSLQKCCQNSGHFLDIGGNYGWYALLLASMGCLVDTFEPVPWFASVIEFSRDVANNQSVRESIMVHKQLVSRSAVKDQLLVIPRQGILGTAGINGHHVFAGGVESCSHSSDCFNVTSTSVDKERSMLMARSDHFCGMKVDVEGHEPDVFIGARHFVLSSRPAMIIIELSPGMNQADRFHKRVLAMLKFIVHEADYAPHLLHWYQIRGDFDWLFRGSGFLHHRRFTHDLKSLVQSCGDSCMLIFTSNRHGQNK